MRRVRGREEEAQATSSPGPSRAPLIESLSLPSTHPLNPERATMPPASMSAKRIAREIADVKKELPDGCIAGPKEDR